MSDPRPPASCSRGRLDPGAPASRRPPVALPAVVLAVALGLGAAPPVAAAAPGARPSEEPHYRFGIEAKVHYRDSDLARFPSPFPFAPIELPPGQPRAFMETVDAGGHFETSAVILRFDAQFSEMWGAGVKVDVIDRYDRNPTSSDSEVDLDELWIRFGKETEPGFLPDEGWGFHVKLGKLPKFERQDDRHLESYGLVSTAFNRMEDVGLELGSDIGRHLYFRSSITAGNPVFIRDPNALAGDNGTPIFESGVPNPVSELKTGLPILYDADIDDLGFDNPEVGLGIGARFGGDAVSVDGLVWTYERELAAEAGINGTFYGGDLDLLRGPGDAFPPPGLEDGTKREVGANLWLYAGGFALFGQYVDSELGGLDRTGWEAEASWRLELPLFWAIGEGQVLPAITPAIRYSKLDPDFEVHPQFPAPSIIWDWEKIDYGLRVALYRLIDLTVEYQDNTFVRRGVEESNDELLVTLRIGWERERPSP